MDSSLHKTDEQDLELAKKAAKEGRFYDIPNHIIFRYQDDLLVIYFKEIGYTPIEVKKMLVRHNDCLEYILFNEFTIDENPFEVLYRR